MIVYIHVVALIFLRGLCGYVWVNILTSSFLKVSKIQTKLIRLPYAFKMRQDYLSTSYLDQKYLPSERSETREI